MIEAGTVLQHRYRIDKQIGQGGMGAVYVATDERFNSTVAIKQTLCMDDNYRRAIEREARLLNSLKHSALPRVSDHFVENDGQFLVMEFIPGEDLCCVLDDRGKPFDVETVIGWADQLLDALDFLHNQTDPVIHRDIKPQNLKLTSGGQIVLLDFGLAKGNPNESNNKTAAKSIFGYTRNYASLEQIQGTGTDPRSDLYSLAATLYHLVTGSAPEDALTRAMAVLSHRPDPLIPAHIVDDKIPRGFSAILHSALDLNADARPSTAAEMRETIARYEDFSALASDVHPTAGISNPAVFSQKTKLMPEATVGAMEHPTALGSGLVEDGVSETTRIRETAVAAGSVSLPGSAGGARKFAFAAGGLGSLLLVGVVAGTVLLYEADAEPVSPIESGSGAITNSDVSNITVANSNDSIEADRALSMDNTTQEVRRDQPPPASETRDQPAKQQRAAAPQRPEGLEIETPEGRMVIAGDTIYMGDTKIVGNKVYTPEGVFQLKRPPIPPKLLELQRELEANRKPHLSPQERRELIRTFRRYNTNSAVRIPPEPPNPDDQ